MKQNLLISVLSPVFLSVSLYGPLETWQCRLLVRLCLPCVASLSLSLSHVLVCACFYGQYPTALIGAGKRSEAAPPPTPMELENPPIPLIRDEKENVT